jgi:hypothetical protein
MSDGFKIYRVETLLSPVISLLINICRRNGGGSAQQLKIQKQWWRDTKTCSNLCLGGGHS